ncbi:MAG: 23S rRNA (uracil(1939)-C(5))-methyltransferase RlmD [Lachnospiraceae bacterium]
MSRRKKREKEELKFPGSGEPIPQIRPDCRHFGDCGGCTYHNISYENQLILKAGRVKKLIDEVYDDYDFEGILPSPVTEGYRNKMEFTFGDETKGGPFALGLHRKGSFFDIVNINDCLICRPDINTVRNAARDYFDECYKAGRVDFYNRKSHCGYLRHLLVRCAVKTGEILVALVTASPESSTVENEKNEAILIQGFAEMIENLHVDGTIASALHITNDSLSDAVKADKVRQLFGRNYINEEVLGLRFRISVFSFFQTNTLGSEVLYSKVREYAAKACGTLFDLYSGTGTVAQLMAPAVDKVVGVEIVSEAVKAAEESAKLNGVKNVSFIAADVLKALDTLPAPDSLILDPPREGVHPKALGKILRYGVENIVYISCKPTSLVRDLAAFKVAGYELMKVVCVDMFPATEHVETVVLMSKVKGR